MRDRLGKGWILLLNEWTHTDLHVAALPARGRLLPSEQSNQLARVLSTDGWVAGAGLFQPHSFL